MRELNDLCGERFVVWDGENFGHCFLELCVIAPVYCVFCIISSYYSGFRIFRLSLRSRNERFIITSRLFISIALAVLFLCKIYVIFKSGNSKTVVHTVATVLKMFTWVMHFLYLRKLLFGVTYRIKGPTPVVVSFLLCFCSTVINFYYQCHSSHSSGLNFYLISELVFCILYVITLLPRNVQRNKHELTGIVNESLNEQEPLINSMLSRYYSFHEEANVLDLGPAEKTSNIFKKLFFLWVNPLMLKGSGNDLKKVSDLYDLPHSLNTNNLDEKFCSSTSNNETEGISFGCFKIKTLSLVSHLHNVFAYEFYAIGIVKFTSDTLSFGGPVLLQALVSFLESDKAKDSKDGYYYAFGLFLVTLFASLFAIHYNYFINRISLKIKASIMTKVYTKTLQLSKITLSRMNTGEIINFLSTDAERIDNFCQSFHSFWSLPLQLAIALGLLYQQINFCFLVGIAFMVIIIPINHIVAKKIANYSSVMMTAKDKRIKLMNEILSGIRVIKMNSWESMFSEKLRRIRHEEVACLKKRKYLDALCVYFWATTPVLISFLSFTLYASLGYTLTASKVFTSIALFNMLITPLNAFPWVINGIVEAWISAKRVNVFLQLPNLNLDKYYSELEDESTKLEILNGVFSYNNSNVASNNDARNLFLERSIDNSNYVLGPVNLKLNQGDFVCVIGKVGSGKSSLLSGILADMNAESGRIRMVVPDENLGIGYVSQEPWIQQKTVQENILFGKRLNVLRYRKVLEACALLDDLEHFPNGDQTEVGDKGVTLSGGQKARVALARAVYQDFDFYLLDDPLLAVDAHVADHIFSNCIMGILKNKTKIMCTHKTQFAEKSDYMIVLSEGKIVTSGPPKQVMQLYPMTFSEETDAEEQVERSRPTQELSAESGEYGGLVQVEEKEDGVVKFRVYKTYSRSVGSCLTLLVLLFCFLMQASRTISDWWLSFWVTDNQHLNNTETTNFVILPETDSFLSEATPARSVTFYLSVYGSIAVINTVCTLFRAFLFAFAGLKAAIVLHNRLLKNIIKATCSFFDSTPLGRIMNRFSSDVYCIDETFPFVLNILLAQVFSLVGCIVITCYGLPWTLVPIVVFFFVCLKIQRYYSCTSRDLKRLSRISLSPIYAHFAETLDGQTTIRAMSATGRFRKENMEKIDSNVRACLSMSAASQWLNVRLQLIGVVIVTSVALISLLEREFSIVNPGLVGLALSYALSVTSLLNGAVTTFAETEKEIVSVERVLQYVDEVRTETDAYSQLAPYAWPSHGVITFANVSLQYRPHCPYALRGVSFETRPGEKIGVVGRTGSGKSSLIQVLFRLVDGFEGAVFIDGVNIANLELQKLRSNLSVIPQHPFLFSGTIRENLDPLFLKSDAQILKALRECHVDEKVSSLGGLDAVVEEQGQNFSIGERQLLCLARALLRSTKILCLDEATANIDYRTDSLIRHTVRMAFRRSTLLVIAHRTESVLDCDRVMVLRDGHIAEMDRPSVLLSDRNSHFYGLVYGGKNERSS